MKKLVMNENWELEEFEDNSNLFLLVVTQSIPECGYIHNYDTDPLNLQNAYKQLQNQYNDSEVDGLLRIQIIKVPNTKQVCNCVSCCDSLEKGNTTEAIEAINHLLNRADCEVLESWYKEPLTEAVTKKRHKPYDSVTYTTGDPALNINFFNSRFGTSSLGSENTADSSCSEVDCEGGLGESLNEAKREIKRYYIRPFNLFAANKAEILKILATHQDSNCSIYSLKSLEDHDDVHLLRPSDIIYYYDEGVLRDKNKIPVLDYNLAAKKEEERARIQPETTSDERFKDVYKDRITKLTVVETLENKSENSPRTFMLYCHTNKINNKKYFGITSQKDYSRWRHGEGYKNQPVFYAAIQKYGWENFNHEVICTDLTQAEAKALEKEYINKYHTYINDPYSAGYNTTIGGESNLRYNTEAERKQAQKATAQRNYLSHREARLAKAKQQYLNDTEKFKLRNKLKYLQHRDQYLAKDKEYQKKLKIQLELIRDLNKLFPNRLSQEDLEKIKNFRNCRNAEYLSHLFDLFTDQEIDCAVEAFMKKEFEDISAEPIDVEDIELNFDNTQDNKFTEALTEDLKNICCICGEEYEGDGNNPAPVSEKGRCCNACNLKFVIPARIELL